MTTIETRHPGACSGERRSLRRRPPLVVLVLVTFALTALLAPAAMAQPRGAASDPLALFAVQQAELLASDGAAQCYFGYAVALSDETALVGAAHKQIGANEGQGAAYVFVRSGAAWSQQGDALTASDGAAGDSFGLSVALSGDTAVVGAISHQVGANAEQGAVCVFVRSGAAWSQQTELTANDGAAGDQFGGSIALSGDTVLAGAAKKQIGANEAQGAAYVFVRSGASWSQQTELTADDGAAIDQFGWSVALSGDTALVGAPSHQVGAKYVQGAAYVFVRSGAAWSRQGDALTASDGAEGDAFGYAVALSGDTALVGAPTGQYAEAATEGGAYVFVRAGGVWTQQGAALTATDGVAGDSLGRAVALFGDTALVGAPRRNHSQGAAYLFARSGAAWSQRGGALIASEGAAVDWFGRALALSGDTALVGAPFKEVGTNTDQGAAYVFSANTSLDLAYQLSSRPAGVDPLYALDSQAAVVVDALFDGLTSWDAQTSAVLPAAASSWDANAKVTVWTFHLRADAKFSNGAPVTAQDFKFAWERLLTGGIEGWGSYLLSDVKGAAALAAGKTKHLSGVVARDKTTLVVTLKAPFADFPSTVANPSLAPVPRGLLSTAKKAARYRNAPVGNGPFMLAKPWDRKSKISLVADSAYWGIKPHLTGITFTVIEDPAVAYAQFQAGTFDVANFPDALLAEVSAAYGTSADGFTAEPGQQVVRGPDAGILWGVFNTRKAPLDNVLVRRAFSLALDRTQLSASLLPSTLPLVPATGVLSPGVPGYVPDQWLYATLDLTQAAALLTEAGFPGGAGLPQITFLTTNKASKAEYKTDLAAIGVNVRFVEVSPAKFWGKWDSGKFMMCQDGRSPAVSPTAADLLYNSFYGPLDGSGSFYDDATVNAALRRACATRDDAARLAAFQSIDATIAAAVPVTPVAYWTRNVVCSARLHEAVLSPMDLFDFARVSIE